VVEYAPLSIKSSVVGYGLAGKEQVQFMVRRLLENENAFDSPDAADALAIAICHITRHRLSNSRARLDETVVRIVLGARFFVLFLRLLRRPNHGHRTCQDASRGEFNLTARDCRPTLHSPHSRRRHGQLPGGSSRDCSHGYVDAWSSRSHIDRPINLSRGRYEDLQGSSSSEHFNIECASKAKNIADTARRR